MPKKGLPMSVKMRHDSHYVDELSTAKRTVGKIIPIDKIQPNPDQPRVEFGDLSELTSSIKEQGVLEPLLVRPDKEKGLYMIIAGERRWRASNLAGLKEVPCIELDIDDNAVAEIALVENLQRKDLTIWEIADGLADLNDRYGYTHEDIARKIGKSRTTVTESMAIAGLPQTIRNRCLNARISSKSTLVEISRQFDESAMNKLIDQIESEGLDRKQIRKKKTHKVNKQKASAQTFNNSENNAENNSSEASVENIFKYESERNDFEVKISFKEQPEDDRVILKALKEAFDYVKTK